MAGGKICRELFKITGAFILGIFLAVVVPVLIILATPLYLFRFFVSKLARLLRPDFGKILHTRGATLSADNIYSGSPTSNIFVAGIVNGTLSLDTFRQNVMRVVMQKAADGSLHNQEIQQELVSWMGYHFWRWDQNFRIENHVRMYDGVYKDRVEKEGCNLDMLRRIAAEFIRTPFTPGRSPWEAVVIHNVTTEEEEDSSSQPKSMVALRIHHSLADGFSVLKVITIDLMVAQYERAQALFVNKSRGRKILEALWTLARAPFEGAYQIIESIDINEWHIAESKLERDYIVGVSPRIPLQVIKDIKNQHDTSFTCILLAAFAGGIRKFMLNNGYKVPRTMHCLTPLPMPNHPSKLRNHMTLCVITLPTGYEDPLDRVYEVSEELERQKRSSVPLSMFALGPVMGSLPAWLIGLTFRNYATSTVLTSMPGPDRKIDFLGCPLEDVVFGGGLLAGNCGVGLSSLSYNGAIRIGAGVDTAILSEDDKIMELTRNIQEELAVLASQNV